MRLAVRLAMGLAVRLAMTRIGTSLAALAIGAITATAANAQAMKLTSPDIKDGGTIASEQVFDKFGCTGKNISPALSWSGAPSGTKSFALSIHDPDAPTGSGWWHWVVFNIPASTTSLPKDAGDPKKGLMPKGAVQSLTDFGFAGYGGPCPPRGDKPHHYHITVFALKVDKLDIPGNGTAAMVGFNLNANKLATARVTGLYAR